MPSFSSHEGGGGWAGGLNGIVPLSRGSGPFGDGRYSENVIQGGSVVQPQANYAAREVIGSGVGTVIGSAWSGSGSAFDDNANQANTASRWLYGTEGYIGKDWGNPRIVNGFKVWSTSNYGFHYPNNGVAAGLELRGSNTNDPATAAVLLTTTAANTWNTITTGEANDAAMTTPYRYHWVRIIGAAGASAQVSLAECQFNVNSIAQSALVITGAATVAPDAETGASVLTCDTLVLDGASASLKPSTNSKGLLVLAKTRVLLLNGAKLNIDALGKGGNYGDIQLDSLIPSAVRRKYQILSGYVAKGEGAAGAAAQPSTNTTGYTGSAGGAMQSGGGGSGCHAGPGTDPGGKGGPCAGGAGSTGTPYMASGARVAPEAYGGKGGWFNGTCSGASGGGAGDPIGPGTSGVVTPASGAGGGLLVVHTPNLNIGSGCIVSADGGRGGSDAASGYPGAGAGGGIVCISTQMYGYTNGGTVRAAGGLGGPNYGNNPPCTGGTGGAGSVNIFVV